MPGPYVVLAHDAIAQLLMLANVRFALAQGYFDGPADLRPLLHMWSLAVEEQFYIVFPVLLMIAWRLGRPAAFRILLAITAASFGFSIWGSDTYPTATFYFLPTRMWELLVGALLAILRPPHLRHRLLCDGLSLAGLALILVPVLTYNTATEFPGAAALPPCMGTGLLIYTGGGRMGVVYRVLSARPLQLIGLMSYSLYLWHWPVLAYMRYTIGPDISVESRFLAIGAIAVVSFFSWRLIETPVRQISDSISLWRIASGATLVSGVLVFAGLLIHTSRGVPQRIDKDIRLFDESVSPIIRTWNHNGPLKDRKWQAVVEIGAEGVDPTDVRFLLWGDSHAAAISSTVHGVATSLDLPGAAATVTPLCPSRESGDRFAGKKGLPMLNGTNMFYNDLNVMMWTRCCFVGGGP